MQQLRSPGLLTLILGDCCKVEKEDLSAFELASHCGEKVIAELYPNVNRFLGYRMDLLQANLR